MVLYHNFTVTLEADATSKKDSDSEESLTKILPPPSSPVTQFQPQQEAQPQQQQQQPSTFQWQPVMVAAL